MTVEELVEIIGAEVGSGIPCHADYAPSNAKTTPDSGYLVVRQTTSSPDHVRETDYPISEMQNFMLHAFALKQSDVSRVLKAGELAALKVRNRYANNLFIRFGSRSSGHSLAAKRMRYNATRLLIVRHANTN